MSLGAIGNFHYQIKVILKHSSGRICPNEGDLQRYPSLTRVRRGRDIDGQCVFIILDEGATFTAAGIGRESIQV